MIIVIHRRDRGVRREKYVKTFICLSTILKLSIRSWILASAGMEPIEKTCHSSRIKYGINSSGKPDFIPAKAGNQN